MTHYEWCIETCTDDEYEDIIDMNFSDTLNFSDRDFVSCENEKTRLVLVRDEGNQSAGLQDRLWAYVQGGQLPVYFSDSADTLTRHKVPQKYYDELAAFLEKIIS